MLASQEPQQARQPSGDIKLLGTDCQSLSQPWRVIRLHVPIPGSPGHTALTSVGHRLL